MRSTQLAFLLLVATTTAYANAIELVTLKTVLKTTGWTPVKYQNQTMYRSVEQGPQVINDGSKEETLLDYIEKYANHIITFNILASGILFCVNIVVNCMGKYANYMTSINILASFSLFSANMGARLLYFLDRQMSDS